MGKKRGKKKAASSEASKSPPEEQFQEAESKSGAQATDTETSPQEEVKETAAAEAVSCTEPDVVTLEENLGAMAIEPVEEQSVEKQSSSKSKRQRKKKKAQKDTSELAQQIVGLLFADDPKKTAPALKETPRKEIPPPCPTQHASVSFSKQPTPLRDLPSDSQDTVQRLKKPEYLEMTPKITSAQAESLQQPCQRDSRQFEKPMQSSVQVSPTKQSAEPGPSVKQTQQQHSLSKQLTTGEISSKQPVSMVPQTQQSMPAAPLSKQPGVPPSKQQPTVSLARQQLTVGSTAKALLTGPALKQASQAGPSFKKTLQSHPSGAAGEPHYQRQLQLAKFPEGMKPPKRKGAGTLGRKIPLTANHFEVKFPYDRVIYHYDVDFKPDLKSQKDLKRKIIDQMEKSNPKIFGNKKCVFDGEKNLYNIHDLNIGITGITLTVALTEDTGRGKNEFEVQIKQVAEVPLMILKQFLEGAVRELPQTQVQSLDIVLRHLPSMKFTTVGRSIFPGINISEPLGGGVEMWRGFYLSLRPGMGGRWKTLQLNLDISNRTFYKAQPVIDFVCEYFKIRKNELRTLRCTVRDWQEFAREIRRMKVEVTHTHPMKRKYNIINVTEHTAAETRFPMKLDDGTERMTSVARYFLEHYKMNLLYPNLPCLQASPADKHRYLPMEVCIIVPGQQCKKLTDIQTSDMIKKSAVPAPERKAEIKKLIRQANFNEDPHVKEFGLSVSDNLMSLEGRILPPPEIELAGKKVMPKFGVWNMADGKLCEVRNLDEWILVNFDSKLRDCRNFVDEFKRIGKSVGIHVQEPIEYIIGRLNLRDIQPMYQQLKRKYSNLQLIINILPGKTPIYAEIKRIGDTIIGIATQCIQSKNLKKLSPATLVNIFLKINAKLGGTNSKVEVTRTTTHDIFNKPVIFFGADVTHPPAGDKSKPSIAAIVASMDKRACLYSAKVCVQQHRIEIIQDLKTCVRELLIEFKNKLHAEPARIIFYRDGVGEGQFAEVLIHELTAIRDACMSLSQNYKPLITFLVVQKRHHTRLFCDEQHSIGRSKNIPPGTTVDHTITHPIENDFYLCSHQGIQGTSRPTHYHVLWDDSDFSPDELQMLTYQLCHTYVRCSRSVSIPAPAYYAHLVAFRARYHLENEQKRVDSGDIDPETSFKKMKEAVLIHERLQKMYFV